MAIIRSKYHGRCRQCRNPYRVGDSVFWQRGIKGVLCLKCHNDPERIPNDQKPNAAIQPKGNEDYFSIDWAEFKEYCRNAVEKKDFSFLKNLSHQRMAQRCLAGGNWQGFSEGQLQRWLREGYQTEMIKGLADFTPPIREKRRIEFVEEGDEFHVDLAWNGDDNFMSQWTKREVIPGVSVEVRGIFSAMTSAEIVNQFWSWVCRVIYSLESSGVDCEVLLDFTNFDVWEGKHGLRTHSMVKVKKENEIADFTSFSAMLSPASLRGLGFTAMCLHADRKGQTASAGLGRNADPWKVEYNAERRKLEIWCQWQDPREFPEANMTNQLRSALQTAMRS